MIFNRFATARSREIASPKDLEIRSRAGGGFGSRTHHQHSFLEAVGEFFEVPSITETLVVRD